MVQILVCAAYLVSKFVLAGLILNFVSPLRFLRIIHFPPDFPLANTEEGEKPKTKPQRINSASS